MRNKPFRLFFRQLFFEPGNIAVVLGGVTVLFTKQTAEGAQAFKADQVTNVGDADPFFSEHFLGGFYPFLGEVLMRRFAIDPDKYPVKMKTGEKSLL